MKALIGCAGITVGCSDRAVETATLSDSLTQAITDGLTPVSDAEAAQLPFSCDGPVEKAPRLILQNITDIVTPYHCRSRSGAAFARLVDEQGNAIELDDVRRRDALAFRDLRHRMAPELETWVAKAPTRVKAGVWFAVPDDMALSASDVFLLSDEDRNARQDAMRKRLSELATALGTKIQTQVPGVVVASYSPGLMGQAPYLAVQASSDQLRAIGLLDGVVELTLDIPPEEEKGQMEVWYDLDQIPDLITNGGLNGSGITIVDVLGENGVFDSTNLSLKAGSCQPVLGGPTYTCYCPAAAPHAPGTESHMQEVLGIIKNNHPSLRGGAASDATTIVGNVSTTYCPSASIAAAVDWAVQSQGATVVNRSASNGTQTSRYLDWVSGTDPWPTVVAAAGNSAGTVDTTSVNAIVVGAVDDHGSTSPATATLASFSSWQNPSGGAAGYEVPHVMAPGVAVVTVPAQAGGSLVAVNGTSFATPQVSGIVAALQEKYSNLKFWPSGSLALLMVGANEDIDGPQWLSLSDAEDDKDGAGLVNARGARRACDKVDGGGVSAQSAFDIGTFFSSTLHAGGTYTEIWNAQAAPFFTLRVALKVNAINSCTAGDVASCTVQKFPRMTLTVRKAGTAVGVSANINSTYQFVAVGNGSTTANYTIEVRLDDWDTLTVDDFGIAWSSELN